MADNDQETEIFTTAPWYVESQFSKLPAEDITFLISNSQRRWFTKGEVICELGTEVKQLGYIHQGLVKCVVLNSAGEMKTVFYNDQFLALECFFHRQPSHYSVFAEMDTELYWLDDSLTETVLQRSGIRDAILKALSLKCRILGWQVADLSMSTPLTKVCRLLCCYASSDCIPEVIGLTHQDIADMTGLHRVTITNQMNQLKKMNIIAYHKNGKITIEDWTKLKELGFDGCI